MKKAVDHKVCDQMRQLRVASGLSLSQAAALVGVPDVVLGSYERGDRNPPLSKVESVFRSYGYTLTAVPEKSNAVRLPTDMATELRRIADQLERKTALLEAATRPMNGMHQVERPIA